VSTGKLFGVYSYNESLGFKVVGVPVMIGLNWVILVYGSNAVVSKITSDSILKIAAASALMVIYDLVLEKAALLMKMWKFEDASPPFRNYLMWFLLAVLFQTAIEIFKLNTKNKPARALFIIQFFFFTAIVIYSLIFIR
jgi:putative membrane protein